VGKAVGQSAQKRCGLTKREIDAFLPLKRFLA
jgi:hypothetical protein